MIIFLRLTALLILTLLPLGCAVQPETTLPDGADSAAFDKWLPGIFPYKMQNADSIRSLGTLEEEQVDPLPAAHHGAKNWKRVTYSFPGLRVFALINNAPPHKALVSNIAVSSSNWRLSDGLSVGEPSSNIKAAIPATFGGPHEYCGMNNCIKFKTAHEDIESVELHFYVD